MFEVFVTSSVLIAVLALLRRLWRGRIGLGFQYALWFLVAVRLLLPLPVFGNVFSVMNVVDGVAKAADDWGDGQEAEITSDGSGFREAADAAAADAMAAVDGFSGSGYQSALYQEGVPAGNEADAGESAGKKGEVSFKKESSPAYMGNRELNVTMSWKLLLERAAALKLVKAIWYVGILISAAGALICNILFRRRLYRERLIVGKRNGVSIYVARNLESPCLYGILRPAVYLTPEVCLSERSREHAIAHELTHYRHGDHVWILVRNLCAVIYWFDPLVWLAVRLSARDCELACDAGTIRRLGEGEREAYGCTLIELACRSAGRMRMLRCATDLSSGKKELKERITMIAEGKKKKGFMAVLAALCAVCLAACTFGSAKEDKAKGRYVEADFEGNISISNKPYLVQDGKDMRIVSYAYTQRSEWVSTDGGENFVEEMPEESENARIADGEEFAAATDGTRILAVSKKDGDARQYIWHLISGDGTEIALETPAGSEGVRFFYGAGYFYAINEYQGKYTICQVEPQTGEVKSLLDLSNPAYYLAANEELLCIIHSEGVVLYDLEKGGIAEKQDDRLSDYLASLADTFQEHWNGEQAAYYLVDGGIYLLTRGGLVWHELYSDSFEQVIDGSICSIGDSAHNFCGMAVNEGDGEKEFLLLFSDKKLLRYQYDPEADLDAETLRVYTAYEDTDVRRLVAAFREEYPEIQIKYEVGVNPQYGGTYEDALRSLATELAAGTGPDILFVDELPYLSYVEKGALLELSDFRQELAENAYFTKIIDGMETEQGLYAVPLSFVIPLWGGQADKLEENREISSLAEWADLLERAAAEDPEGGLLGALSAESLVSLLSMSSLGEWSKTGGGLDKEAVEEFLVQAKRIYDIQMSILPEEYKGASLPEESAEENWVTRLSRNEWNVTMAIDMGFILYPKQTFWAGYLKDREYDILNTFLKYGEYGYRQLPGQSSGKCLPVSMAAVNSSSRHMEESRIFLEFALSEKYQRAADMYGFPVSRAAFSARQMGAAGMVTSITGIGSYGSNGDREYVDVKWPNEEAFGKLNDLADSIEGINVCEYQVYKVISEAAVKALKGEYSVEKAVAEIEQRLSIYMAE